MASRRPSRGQASSSTRLPWPSRVWQRWWPGTCALAPVDLEAEPRQPVRGGLQLRGVVEQQRRVRLAGRGERVLDADVHLGRHLAGVGVRPEPGAAAPARSAGFGDLGQAEALGPEAAGDVLAAGAGRRPGRGGASCALRWSCRRDLRDDEDPAERQHHAVVVGRVRRREPRRNSVREAARAARRAAPAASGRAPVPETQVKTGSSPVSTCEVRRLPRVDGAAEARPARRGTSRGRGWRAPRRRRVCSAYGASAASSARIVWLGSSKLPGTWNANQPPGRTRATRRGQQLEVAGHPLEGGVGDEHVDRGSPRCRPSRAGRRPRRRGPARRRGPPRSSRGWSRGRIAALRPAVGEQRGQVAGAAAEVDDGRAGRRRRSAASSSTNGRPRSSA